MKLLVSWLKEFVDVTAEPARLAEDLTLAGLAVDAVESLGSDVLLDLDITTNRVDCMNVYGVAREVATLYGLPLKPVAVDLAEAGGAAADALAVEIEAAELCPRFCVRVLDVRIAPSPAWLRDRLQAVGVRPINNVVDLTNYVMLELGQPTHAFDLARIPEARLVVRWARAGEALRTLDGVERPLGPLIGVVAGPELPLALAGIMGGAASEVTDATRSVALEAAYWDPLSVRRAAKALGMHTEASHRFERDADPEAPPLALARLGHLLQRLGAGSVRPGVVDRVARPCRRGSAVLRRSRLVSVLGVDVPAERAHAILGGLGFKVSARREDAASVAIPSWRGDVQREIDLIEEVARHVGVNKIPSRLPPARRGDGLKPAQRRERRLRDTLVGADLVEVVNLSFVASTGADPFPGPRVALANPLAADQDTLRRSLVFPGLLTTLVTNLRQGRRDVRVFEIGRAFALSETGVREERRLAILISGAAGLPHWSGRGRRVDFFDLKGLLEAVAARLDIRDLKLDREALPALLHPGKSARVLRGDAAVGLLGALHPDVAAAWELKDEALVAEFRLDEILAERPAASRFRPLPRFPPVERDLSLVCDVSQPVDALAERVRRGGGAALRDVVVIDRYEGPPVPAGRVSVTLSLRYQRDDRTLTSEEVQESVARIIGDLKAAGAEVRAE